ncbi:MAG: sigma-70 family RNA polymerase sigma factor [Gemmatimonadota bacterium]
MDEARRDKDRQFELEALCWFPDVTRYALSLTRNEADADDLVQDTFLRAYRGWDSYTPGTECRGWLFTICRNTFLRSRQRDEREVQTAAAEIEALAAAALHASATQSGLTDIFSRTELSDAIARAIDELPPAFRDVVLLIDVNDQSYADAADTLSIPVGTVRSRLFRARRLLQETLLEYAHDIGLPTTDRGVPHTGETSR